MLMYMIKLEFFIINLRNPIFDFGKLALKSFKLDLQI
jgi:hypothetical protein